MNLADCRTKHLFYLIGGNTLPNYVATQLLADEHTTLYLVYSAGTVKEREALSKTLISRGFVTQHQIVDIKVEASNPGNIFTMINNRLVNIPNNTSVGLHYTGGTKVMAVHAYRALQNWQRERKDSRQTCYTYLDAQTLCLWAERSDWKGAQSLFVGDMADISLEHLLMLHRRDTEKPRWKTEAIWPSVTQELVLISRDESSRKSWVSSWSRCKKDKKEDEIAAALENTLTTDIHKDSRFQKVYERLSAELNLPFPTTFGLVMKASRFSQEAESYSELVKWFTGGWLEHYVFTQLHNLTTEYSLHDLALNIEPEPTTPGRKFELDITAIRHYQLIAISCTLERGRTTAKQKLLEAVARARQLGGSEASIGLVSCCSADDVKTLHREAEALVRENKVKIFGIDDLVNLQENLGHWFDGLTDKTGR